MSKEWLEGILSGASFPNLDKAVAAKGLKELLSKIKPGESIYEPVNEKKAELEKQYRGDFRAAILSHGAGGCGGGIRIAVPIRNNLPLLRKTNNNGRTRTLRKSCYPATGARRVAPKKLPKNRGVSPVANAAGRQPATPSIGRTKVGGLNTQTLGEYKVETVTPRKLDGKGNFRNFAAGQAGFKGKSIDKSVSITHDGTPQYGDDQINQANQDNLSANLATTPPTLDFPSRVSAGATIDANKIKRAQPGQTQDKGDTVGNILKLGAIGAALTALLFLIRDIIGVVSFVINIASLTSTVTNIAQSFLAIFDGIASLMGLGDGISKPISETFDGILNNVFGKEKVDYVKYNFARINTVFTAGANVFSKIRSTSAALAEGIEENAQNNSKIGNALRRCGVVDERLAKMDEEISVRIDKSQLKILNDKLAKVSNVSSNLSGIADDLKTAKTELAEN
ncbi:MAG: hypothetical protein HC778_00570 [Chamaesiphon sp. CSU_1_12]|nr:hypothetical protein [Chamaesiphon sp. CSU_1_12]